MVHQHRTLSEEVFERFLTKHSLSFDKIATADTPRPDYFVTAGDLKIVFEIKELTRDENFKITRDGSIAHRIIGDHVRSAITQAAKQIQYGAKGLGLPSILLIYNKIDHCFGTENHDFIAGMYGEPTLLLDPQTGAPVSPVFHGRNARLRNERNTSFSAVGRLSSYSEETRVTVFENVYAHVPIPYEQLPACLEVVRIEIKPT